MCLVMVACTASFVMSSVYEMPSTILRHLVSTAWIFPCSSAVCVHASRVHKKTDRTNACSSFSLVEILMFLSLHVGFSFANAAAVYAALAAPKIVSADLFLTYTLPDAGKLTNNKQTNCMITRYNS